MRGCMRSAFSRVPVIAVKNGWLKWHKNLAYQQNYETLLYVVCLSAVSEKLLLLVKLTLNFSFLNYCE